jgi:hypothetical protein
VGGAVHSPSPTAHCKIVSPEYEQLTPKSRWILAHIAPHSVNSSSHGTGTQLSMSLLLQRSS